MLRARTVHHRARAGAPCTQLRQPHRGTGTAESTRTSGWLRNQTVRLAARRNTTSAASARRSPALQRRPSPRADRFAERASAGSATGDELSHIQVAHGVPVNTGADPVLVTLRVTISSRSDRCGIVSRPSMLLLVLGGELVGAGALEQVESGRSSGPGGASDRVVRRLPP